jgi:uncharacterized protein YndB with AHSA1/START domain
MKTNNRNTITVETTVGHKADRVWEYWVNPEHITKWNFAIDEWHCPSADNDLRPGGRFSWRMEAKDGSMGFDYSGTYDHVKAPEQISCTLDDGRKVVISFTELGNETKVTETFEVEDVNTMDQQRTGWQAILDNFKKYAESKK